MYDIKQVHLSLIFPLRFPSFIQNDQFNLSAIIPSVLYMSKKTKFLGIRREHFKRERKLSRLYRNRSILGARDLKANKTDQFRGTNSENTGKHQTAMYKPRKAKDL